MRHHHRSIGMQHHHRSTLWSAVFSCGLSLCSSELHARTQAQLASTSSLKSLSLEELMDVEVTSVSRTEETLGGAAAAIAVVTNEDIRRSGATSIPEALRMVPGIHVARRNSDSWAVSSRGFSSINSEKLLVLSDTRSIYTPLVSGVQWDVQDYLMEDIDRIEVIRGPGAALWGSNAVNGVINITTKSARDTQGLYLEGSTGTEEQAIAGMRHGGTIGENGYFRVFAKYFDRDETFHADRGKSDDWRLGHVGFRGDWDQSEDDTVTLQGDMYRGNIGELGPAVSIIGRQGPQGDLNVDVSGGNVLGRWRHTISADSDWQFRAYYDHTHRNDPSYVDDLDTIDLDFQHRWAPAYGHELLWGLNYRYTDSRNDGRIIFALDPPAAQDSLFSGFVQDQVSLLDSLRLTLGTKLEHNDFSGFEVQPSVRLAWDVAPAQTAWASVSRAVRVPTRLERDIAIDVSNPAGNPIVRLLGNKAFDAERLIAYELGYRWQALQSLFVDVALFHNRYQGLSSLELGAPFIDPRDGRTVFPIVNENLTDGHSQGLETLLTFTPLPTWRLSASYSYMTLSLDPHGQDLNRGRFYEGATPKHQFGLRSFLDLPADFQVDAQFRYLSDIESNPQLVSGGHIDAYSELDLRLAWRGWRQIELSLVGQNLLHDRHLEFGTPVTRGEIERSVYGKVAWNF
jgi:iron complex outermembrane recepter protein